MNFVICEFCQLWDLSIMPTLSTLSFVNSEFCELWVLWTLIIFNSRALRALLALRAWGGWFARINVVRFAHRAVRIVCSVGYMWLASLAGSCNFIMWKFLKSDIQIVKNICTTLVHEPRTNIVAVERDCPKKILNRILNQKSDIRISGYLDSGNLLYHPRDYFCQIS